MNNPLDLLRSRIPPDACGVEIGAHTHPVPGIDPYYVDRDPMFAGQQGRVDVQADAAVLPIPEGELDYLCSSHVLEHLPDPISALLEWWRVLRPGGFLYLIVPDKRFTFDRPRAMTPVEHLLEDFRAGVTTADEAHIADFIFGIDWEPIGPGMDAAGERKHRQEHYDSHAQRLAQGQPVDIHYHTFEPQSLRELLATAGFIGGWRSLFRVVACAERYPPERADGIGWLLQRTGRAGRRNGVDTFCFDRPGKAGRPLPLVCPATLRPLVSRVVSGQTQLAGDSAEASYDIMSGVPQLFVREGVPVRRPWKDSAWRERVLAARGWRRGSILRKAMASVVGIGPAAR